MMGNLRIALLFVVVCINWVPNFASFFKMPLDNIGLRHRMHEKAAQEKAAQEKAAQEKAAHANALNAHAAKQTLSTAVEQTSNATASAASLQTSDATASAASLSSVAEQTSNATASLSATPTNPPTASGFQRRGRLTQAPVDETEVIAAQLADIEQQEKNMIKEGKGLKKETQKQALLNSEVLAEHDAVEDKLAQEMIETKSLLKKVASGEALPGAQPKLPTTPAPKLSPLMRLSGMHMRFSQQDHQPPSHPTPAHQEPPMEKSLNGGRLFKVGKDVDM